LPAALALLLGAGIAACATESAVTPLPGSPEPAPTSAPTTAPATVTPRPSPTRDPRLPSGVSWLEDGVLEAGTYWFNGFDPWLEVTVGEGWEVGHFHRDFFDLFHAGDFPSIGFGRFAEVKHRDGTTIEATSARVVVDGLRSNLELEVTDVARASVAGLQGLTVDIRAKNQQVPLFGTPDGDFRFDPEFLSRWHILDVPGGTIEILVAARPGRLDDAIETTRPILDSVRVGGP
jgi:hypothetical protein